MLSVYAQAQEVHAWGDNRWDQSTVPADLKGVFAISSGVGHSVALKYDGTVTVWGLHAGNGVTGVISIASGNLHTAALKSDGTVVAWGNNFQGQLNIPPGLANVTAIASGNFHSLALKADGTVVAWGSNTQSQSNVPGGLTNVIAISAGYSHSLALKADGTVIGWGTTGGTIPGGLNNVIAIDAGAYFNLALKSDGTVVAWGDNARGQCNIPIGLSDVIAISAGYEHAVALKADGTLVAWGSNEYGQVTIPPSLTGVVEISAGSWFTMARKVNGTRIAVWGSSASTLSPPSFNISDIKAVAAGRTAGLALNPDGTVTAWGTGSVASALPSGLSNVKAAGAGVDHGVALKADGTVVSWGDNSLGQTDVPPGLSDVKALAIGSYHNVALKSDGTVVRWGNTAANTSFPPGLSDVTAIAAGSVHSLALKANGTVAAWGNNFDGQSTVPGDLVNVVDIAGGNLHSLALEADGKVEGWGTNADGQYNFPSNLADVKSVAAGQNHSVVLKSDGTLFTKGRNGTSASIIPSGLNAAIAIDSRLNNNVAIVFDQAPVLSGFATGMNYLEGAAALTLQSTAVITDNGHTSLAGATISISNGFLAGDRLAVTVRGGVTQAYDVATGILTLTGTATITDYQLMLRSLTYESTSAAPALNATRTISVSLNDGAQTGTVSFTLNVIGVNDAPSFSAIGSLITDEDAPAVSVNLLSGISPGPADEAAQTLTIEVENDNTSLFSVQPTINSSGRLSFTLAADAHGTANLTIKLTDDGGTANSGVDLRTRNVSISVNSINDAPLFTKGADVIISEGASAQTVTGWATDMSPGPANESAQTVAFSVSNDNTGLFSAQPSLDAAGNLTFTPAPDASGVANVTATLTDNGGTTFGGVNRINQTFIITINDVNDAPSFTKGSDVMVDEDAGSQNLNGWATSISPGPVNESTQILLFTVSNNDNSLFSSQPYIDASGNLTFTPAADKSGTATVTVTLNDDGGTTNGGIDESTAETFTITIDPVNDSPSFTKGGNVTIDEDASAQTISSWATAISSGPADESSQVLLFTISNDDNSLFSSQPSIDGSGNLTFTPAADKSGTATVTVTLNDDGGTLNGGIDESTSETFTITIDPVNDSPSFTKGGNVTIDEDAGAQTISSWATAISSGPADESSQVLLFTISNDDNSLFSSQPSIDASGNLTFTPATDKSGTATVTVTLNDDGGTLNGGIDESTSETFAITIDPVNDSPSFTKGGNVTIGEDAGAQAMNSWATSISSGPADESSQVLSFTISNDDNSLFSSQPFIDAFGNLTFTPAADKSGTATVIVTLTDDGGTANGGIDESFPETFTIAIDDVNDTPSFTSGSNVTIDEDAGTQHISGWATNISPGPSNESSQQISFSLSNDNTSLFSIQPIINPFGDLTFTSAPGAYGIATVTVTLTDDGGIQNGGINYSEQRFRITINPVNDAPYFVKGSDVIVNEDASQQTINAWASGISAGGGETSQTLNFHISNDNTDLFSMQPSVNASGELSFTLSPDVSGVATVTLSLHDNGGTANSGVDQSPDQTFTITVNAVNDAPSFTKGRDVTVNENASSQTIESWASGISAGPGESAQVLNFVVNNTNNTLFSAQPSVNASGDLSFTPAPGASGVAIVTISIRDNGGIAYGGVDQSDEQTFMITINSINHAPVFTAGQDVVVNEDATPYNETWATGISAGDAGQALTFIVVAENQGLFAVPPAIDVSGALSFALNPDVSGSSAISVHLKDNGATVNGGVDQSAEVTFTITVNPVNDAPHIDQVNDVTIPLNSEPVIINLAGIHPGPGEETQQLSLEVLSDNPSILPGPQLTTIQNGTASLTLSPLPVVTGVATVTIRLSDNGGTAFGGQDEMLMSFAVVIEEEVQAIFLPNFFSPEGNGVNDAFRVRGAGIEQLLFRIYSISGEEVFSTTDIVTATETGWDGKYKGKDLPAGTYTWTLQGRYVDGKPLTSKKNQFGQFVLMR